jgi:predicted DCC family thiol-disulfide oxidoreductase YuxK
MSERPAIIYDGECRFCLWSVGRIQRLDRSDTFEYVPRQTVGVEQRFPILARSDFNTGLRLIFPGTDSVHVGADGVYEIYRRLPPYHLLAWVYRIPVLRSLFRLGYAIIARNRHRFRRIGADLACDSEACDVSYPQRPAGSTAVTPSAGR